METIHGHSLLFFPIPTQKSIEIEIFHSVDFVFYLLGPLLTPSDFPFPMSHNSTIFRHGISNVQLDSKIVCDWRFVA